MPWSRQQLKSDSDPDSPAPWYEFTLNEANARIEVSADKDGGTSFDMTAASLNLGSVNPSKPFRIAITEAGDLITYNMGDRDVPDLRAHLSPATTVQDLVLYEFVE